VIKIKQFQEKWVNGVKYKSPWDTMEYYEIFQNPSLRELKDASNSEVRGIVLKNGDFYIVKNSQGLIHDNILEILFKAGNIITSKWVEDWYLKLDSLDEFLCITQIEKSLEFAIAESYGFTGLDLDDEILNQYKKMFEKKNPQYSLSLELIPSLELG